ncbi:HEAT repeat domain-containing protein [Paenibacillus flagellatus]|uniref:HEAT repeat domain-containing protein n=1 Tax=Paenibacillus flagellatus TaxID=2211139 RepID=A0A2V5JZP1_9BACL|nr:HEAT repeat domain-containing protein [Paenibacillus flagellatus]PYI52261.1 hypothetical protein DLM86_22605 [Paenibacillus flagellatus]
MSGPDLAVLGRASAALLLAVLGLYVYLYVRKRLDLRYESVIAAKLERLSEAGSAMETYLRTGEESRAIRPRRRIDYEALELYLSHRAKSVQNAEERERIAAFADAHFTDRFRSRLRGRDWSARINTLHYMELFHTVHLLPEAKELIEKRTPDEEERVCVYRLMAAFQDEAILDLLRREEERLPDFAYRQLLHPLRPALLDRIAERFDEYPARVRYNFVDIARIRNIRTAPLLRLLESRLAGDDTELNVRVLKALANFGYLTADGVSALRNRVRTPPASPIERLMLARLMGAVSEDSLLPVLQQWIGDESYLVRAESARALIRYRHGKERLRAVAYDHPDRYAREMAMQVLEEQTNGA